MHNLGQSQMEHGTSYEDEYGGGMHESGSPLQEILAGAGAHETYGHEAGFGHEYHEQQEYQEYPAHEYQESYTGEYQEAPVGEYQEYQEFPVGETYTHEVVSGEGGELHEEEMLELTAELLSVNNEEEMQQFLGKLVRRVARTARGFLRSPIGRMVGGVLRQVARRVLPMAGSALGTFVGGPVGTMIGGQLAGMAGKALGLELQEMSPQDADFAAARQFVRLATDIVRRSEQGQGPPAAAVRQAFTIAAQRFAPALLGPNQPRVTVGPVRRGRRGTWVRRGSTITLYGV